ncbi:MULTISPECIES: hypothetical protein [Sphingomonas]|uniref:Uncharacterized protein n=1 Tax=Sphingomonas glacialis TaxID=658225 RepID=A0ABQ3LGW3_9SPHN|nr:hypothetical protein [Sphingomonas glacialis]GHH12442.1 hypothetical protein GCM10008023_12600 [Sphingomonas glacialis]
MKIIAQDPAQTSQRAKVGMIGLAAVLLLIGLASAIFATANHDRQVAAIGSARPDVVANMVAANIVDPNAPKEPLAELGVAPSAATPDGNTVETRPAAAKH